MQAKSVAKYIRISPRKMKPIADLVRGKSIADARAILKFTPNKGAGIFLKVLNSAIANAENNHDMDVDNLFVSEIYANQGPTMKRWKAGSMGRANPRKIRSSHVGVVVSEKSKGGIFEWVKKVSPHGLRVGIIKDWDSKWYADKKDFPALLKEDYDIRKYVKKNYYTSGISRVYVDRTANNRVFVNIFTAKPGMIVGKGGENIKKIREDLEKLTKKNIHIDISEVRNPDVDAQLVAESVAFALERRISFRRAMKQAIQRSMRSGAKGIKISTAGRLGGADMARTEGYSEGNVPLSTLRADIGYGMAEGDTTYGKIGIKVWINNGEVLPKPGEGRVLNRLEARKATDKRPPARRKKPRNTPNTNNRNKK